jgi:hypothetical protein
METTEIKQIGAVTQPSAAPAQLAPATPQPPSPPLSESASTADAKVLASSGTGGAVTPPFSPSSQTPIIQREQEEFEGTVDVNNELPTGKDMARVGDLLVLDAKGQSRPFKELYNAPHVAPRQLIIFIRHFFCGVSSLLSTNTPCHANNS